MDCNLYIINATAIKYGGALTILKELLSEIKKTDSKSIYYVFCGIDLDEFVSDNIRIIKIKTNGHGIGGLKRFYWDSFGLFIFCKKNKINPNLIFSLQNTGVFYPKVKQLIYFHHAIPLSEYKWNLFRKDEPVLFFYKEIYPFFIRLFINRRTEFVVQQEFIKNLFSDKFHIDKDKIHLIIPDINLNFESKIEKFVLDQKKFHIFYPTNQAKFKNFEVLFDAISKIRNKSPEIFEKIILHITLDKDNKDIKCKIFKLQISNNINLLGNIPYKDVISYYNSVNLLVFPSYIETFGLPLIEAAYFGLPILVSDLDYAHEVLKNYQGANFVQFDNSEKWANEIIKLSKTNQKVESFKKNSVHNSWGKLLELFNTIIKKNVQK